MTVPVPRILLALEGVAHRIGECDPFTGRPPSSAEAAPGGIDGIVPIDGKHVDGRSWRKPAAGEVAGKLRAALSGRVRKSG